MTEITIILSFQLITLCGKHQETQKLKNEFAIKIIISKIDFQFLKNALSFILSSREKTNSLVLKIFASSSP